MKCIKEVVRRNLKYAMLSHSVYDSELDSVSSMMKLRPFCKTARAAGYNWAWSDTCCINKSNNVELHESVNSMFIWYHHSALTIIYLLDVLPSSKSGALAKSAWNTRGWTESITVMQELKDTMGIGQSAIKLHWASTQVTTRQEDIAYSLFGIFDVCLPVDCGEKQDKALGQLLQEIVARSGDITGLD
ncbi:hypothetical protein EDD22DRAFT_989635 [Suillus occidentalis]|nr:hypothetical protein EDD22DRAFT_989635 [Suillus occidentalis]